MQLQALLDFKEMLFRRGGGPGAYEEYLRTMRKEQSDVEVDDPDA